MPEDVQGLNACLKALRELGDEEKSFCLKSLRRAARAGAKTWLALMQRVIPKESGVTVEHLALKAAPRRKGRIGMLVGVFMPNTYAGWSNFGHKTRGGKTVEGTRWTDLVIASHDIAQNQMVETLKAEIEAFAAKSKVAK